MGSGTYCSKIDRFPGTYGTRAMEPLRTAVTFTNAMSDGWTDGWMDGWLVGPSRAAKFEAIIMTTSPNGSIR